MKTVAHVLTETKMLLTIVMIAALFLFSSSDTRAEGTVLTPVVGRWQVMGVRLDETLTRTPSYNYDDSRLIGRVIVVTEKAIRTDMPESTACLTPRATLKSSTMDALVRESMARPKKGKVAAADSFNLPVKGQDPINVLWVSCAKGDIGPDTPYGPEGANWIANLSQDELAVRWYDNTILLLKRMAPSR